MDEQLSTELHLALFAISQAVRARAESVATWNFLTEAGVPEEALDQMYFAALRNVIEEARGALKAQGLQASMADIIVDRLITSLPAEERLRFSGSGKPN